MPWDKPFSSNVRAATCLLKACILAKNVAAAPCVTLFIRPSIAASSNMCISVRSVPTKNGRAKRVAKENCSSTLTSGGRYCAKSVAPLDVGGGWYNDGGWNGRVELTEISSLVLMVWCDVEARWACEVGIGG